MVKLFTWTMGGYSWRSVSNVISPSRSTWDKKSCRKTSPSSTDWPGRTSRTVL